MSQGDKVADIHDEEDTNYRPPPEKSLKEIVEADQNDASLQKYKEALLGQALKEAVVVEPNNPSRVLVKKLALVVEGRPDVVLDLTGDLEALKKRVFVVKEGIQYRIRIDFFVQHEIVTGLKYVQKVLRHGLQQEKITHMVGSYAPKLELQSYSTPVDEMPSGMFTRGTYTVKSLFTDDDKNEHLKWEWSFELKKDWE
ncbi:rho GDP-dissociation inhibitor 2 [Parasteatoda tepidariorum]|uniref:rho GDP-dissociation inhibitor 2 n=1 Tax=Parasteatoda tepidariorum TaxID=114398 RepID=UPI00077FE1FB|nr:rho GDP-dissociation inhibitor 2 [Parasteatoda tepidariorum]XP_042913081.1 rho GDP-dissociation inhibitor 2 [Parasteatoda tepidariorum]